MKEKRTYRYLITVLSPVVAFAVAWMLWKPGQEHLAKTAGIAALMALWWIFECIPIYATALLPVILFPMLGVMDMKSVAMQYTPQVIFLFVGGFLLAFALQRWNLHKRIALKIILAVGHTPSRVLLGFMLSSYLLSQWILNTATCMMLLPAAIAVIEQLESNSGGKSRFATPLLLGLAYAASIGGTATLIGTAPNVYFLDFFNTNFTDEAPITFANWFIFGAPTSLILFFCCFLLIRYRYLRQSKAALIDMSYCRNELQKMGRPSFEERILAGIFILTALLWFTMKDINFGAFVFKGWSNLLPDPSMVKESTVAVITAFLLFLIPSRSEKGRMILTWHEARSIPYGVLLLFGGGFALAKGISVSGLSDVLAGTLKPLTMLSPWIMILALCTFMTFFTELTSNTTSTILLLTLLLPLVSESGVPPMLMLMPVTLSASFAFMLPVATPPNTIVFGSDRLQIKDMVQTGFWMNIIGIVVVFIMVNTLGHFVFNY